MLLRANCVFTVLIVLNKLLTTEQGLYQTSKGFISQPGFIAHL